MRASRAASTCCRSRRKGRADRTDGLWRGDTDRRAHHHAATHSDHQRLLSANTVPARMVFVPGGDYRLIAWSRPTDRRVRLDDYFIDKYRVSNQEYKEFVNAGGYGNRELWKHPFVKDGREMPWDDGMRMLVDRTGLPGPRTWSNQSFLEGRANIPSRTSRGTRPKRTPHFAGKGCRRSFSGKRRLATAISRRPAWPACHGVRSIPAIRSRIARTSERVRSRPPRGIRDERVWRLQHGRQRGGMDGERQLGRVSRDRRRVGDPTYTFAQFGGRPGFFSSEKLGFRCARNPAESAGDQGGMRIELDQEVPLYTAPSPQVFAKLASAYRYEKTPLDARIEQTTRRRSGSGRESHSSAPTARARLPISTCRTMRTAAAGDALPPGG